MSDQRRTKRRKGDATNKDESKRGGAQYHCDYCREDITNQIRIKCAECQDFDLCLMCFSNGVEVYPHRNTHAYRVMDHVTTPIFDPDWGADEELLLLEAIEMYGLGNWSDVAAHVDTKSKIQCEQHYNDVYLSSDTAPLPDLNQALPPRGGVEDKKGKKTVPRGKSKTDVKAKTFTPAKPKPKAGLGALVGYLPNRGDFETEYENDAELMLADMEFKPEDTEWERELKLQVLTIYNSKLDARIERKTFILERGLLDPRKPSEPKRSKEEREIYASMRVFARFHSKEEHEAFVQGLIAEKRLRKRVEQLQNMRANGVRTLSEGERFEAAKAIRDSQKKKPILPAMYESFKERGKKKSVEQIGSTTRKQKEKAQEGPFDISQCEGVELLSEPERSLCQELRLVPAHYIAIKKKLMQESLTRGFLRPGQARELLSIEIHKTDRILDFCVSAGWIHDVPPPTSSSSCSSSSSSLAGPIGAAGAAAAVDNSGFSSSSSSSSVSSSMLAPHPPAAGRIQSPYQ
eukprot:gb/GEZN01005701.1/.p1 GENE.gb/GEZN01005701.1/~~gb/GEZN01005701.1/.p1  ORF type:complete len:533 (-),score=102.82 gb/GEZN01005701.1/:165-1715(-)